jgi:hypothetical protein
MRRRSKIVGKAAEARRHPTVAHTSRVASNAVRPHPILAATQDALRLILETALDAWLS